MERKGFGKYVTGKMKRFTPHKVYIFFMRITRRSAGDPDQEPVGDPDQEYISDPDQEYISDPDKEYIHFMESETLL